ncbi:MAG: hypothetical protein ACRDTD_10330 [Pseudonocardiaceae bacterium]
MADAAYGCGAFAGLGHDMTMTTRARSNAVFSEPAPRTGKRGRPRLEGQADRNSHRYHHLSNLVDGHRGVLRHQGHLPDHREPLPVVRHLAHRHRSRHPRARHGPPESPASGYDIALVTNDLTATSEEIIAPYVAPWSIEVTFYAVPCMKA